jgi:hypothetical protein
MPTYDLNATYTDLPTAIVAEAGKTLSGSFSRIEHCLTQLSDKDIWWRPRPEMNAIGNLILHLCGNVEQWIIAPIENRPAQRDRPAEFAWREPLPKSDLLARLSSAMNLATAAVGTLETADQLLAPRRVQGHDTNIYSAIFHSVTHVEGHAQEIIAMTRQLKGDSYQFLWTPKTPEQKSAASS